MTKVCGVQVEGPLAPFAAGFEGALLAQGYSRDRARQLIGLAAEVSHWLGESGLGASPSFASLASLPSSAAIGANNSGTTTEQLSFSVSLGDPLLSRSHRSFAEQDPGWRRFEGGEPVPFCR